MMLLLPSAVVLATLATLGAALDETPLTYGSVVKLMHAGTKYYLHSHSINWGSGSGQQSVTGHGGGDDQGGLWVIKEGHTGAFQEVGSPVPCGGIVRLGHLETGLNLHSHFFQSPLSQQQEVSCFGENGAGDTGDDWEVVCVGAAGATKTWMRGQDVRLKHKDTGRFLHSEEKQRFTNRNCPNCPIVGQQEIFCAQSPTPDNIWKAVAGVFFHPKADDDHDEL